MYYDENAHCILKDGNDSINITLEHRKQKQLKNQIIQNGGKKLNFVEKENYMAKLFKYKNLINKLKLDDTSTKNNITKILFLSKMLFNCQVVLDQISDESMFYDIKHITRALEMDSNKIIEIFLQKTTKTQQDTNEVYMYLEQMVAKLKKEEEIKRITSKEAIYRRLFSF
jgi:hypothetical protein